MKPSDEIDNLIAQNQDWRGETLAKIRKTILDADPEILEEWKWMGSPVWSKNGIICVGNIFKDKVKLVFNDGAALEDPDKIFNAGLSGNKWRAIEVTKGSEFDRQLLINIIRAAILFNKTKNKL